MTTLDVSRARSNAASPTPLKSPSQASAVSKPRPCLTPPSSSKAWLTCDRSQIQFHGEIAFHPHRKVPAAPARAVLRQVAAILRQRSDLLLLRIEAYSSRPQPHEVRQQRREVLLSQARADAIFRYLWRRERISAERMEPVGYGSHRQFSEHPERWPIVLRVVQTAPFTD